MPRISFIWVEEIRVWGQGVSQMISETVHSFPSHRLPCQVGYQWYLHWWRLPLLLLARQSGPPDPRGPPFRHVCSRPQVISTVSRQLCQSETPERPLCTAQHAARPHSLSALRLLGNTDFEPAVFPSSVEFFHFSLLVLILSPALSFQDYHRKYGIQHGFPEGFSAVAFSICPYSVFRKPSSFWHLQTPSCQLLGHH